MPQEPQPPQGAVFNPATFDGVVYYNGVRIDMVKTVQCDIDGVYDQSRTDLMYYNGVFTFEGWVYRSAINPNATNAIPHQNNVDPAVLDVAALRHMLMNPRGNFVYKNSDRTFVSSTPQTQVAKGPNPIRLSCVEILYGCWKISFTIEVPFIECGDPPSSYSPPPIQNINGVNFQQVPLIAGQFNPIGSLRWKSTQTLDYKGYSTISYAGRLIMRIPLGRVTTDNYRFVMTPRVPIGFIRQNGRYVIQEDGMACDFSFEDTEQYAMPPLNAIRWNSTFVREITAGVIQSGACSVDVEGSRYTKKSDLVRASVSLCYETLANRGCQVLQNANGAQGIQYFVQNCTISEYQNENKVSVFMRAPLGVQNNVNAGLSLNLAAYDQIALTIAQGQGRGIAPPLFGNIPGLAFLAQLFNDPCLNYTWQPPDANADSPASVANPQPSYIPASGLASTTVAAQTTGVAAPAIAQQEINPFLNATPILQYPPRVLPALPPDPLVSQTSSLSGESIDNFGNQIGVYTEYEIETRYSSDTGVSALPSGAPSLNDFQVANQTIQGIGTTSSIGTISQPIYLSPTDTTYLQQTLPVKMYAEICEIEIVFKATSMGTRPRLPTRNSSDGNIYLKQEILDMPGTKLTIDNLGTVNAIRGIYVYGVRNPTLLNKFNPLFPWVDIAYNTNFNWPQFDPLGDYNNSTSQGLINQAGNPYDVPTWLSYYVQNVSPSIVGYWYGVIGSDSVQPTPV